MSKDTKKPVVRITVPIDVPVEVISSNLCTAIETSIYYWCAESRPNYVPGIVEKKDFEKGGKFYHLREHTEDYAFYLLPCVEGGSITIIERDDEDQEDIEKLPKHTIGLAQVMKGIQLMAEKYPHHFKDFIGESGDATTADVFVQLCALGDIVYG